MATSQKLVREAGSWAAQVLWITGTFGALLAGYTVDPLWGYAVLGLTLVLTLACGWAAARWNALPAAFGALALQGLACGSMGATALDAMLGNYWFWWSMTNVLDGVQFLGAIAPAFVPAVLLGVLLRSERPIILLRRAATRALPVALAASVVLIALAGYRTARYPTAEHYADDLPVVASIAGLGDACRDDSDGHVLENGDRYCESPTQVIEGQTMFYACTILDGSSRSFCRLKVRGAETSERTGHYFRDPTVAHDVVRDERLGLLIRDDTRLERFSPPERRSSIWLHDIREHIAPPTSWLVLAVFGLGVALLTQLVRRGLVRFLGTPTSAHAEWHTRLRGDLAVVSVATLVITHALLVAALVRGFLV